MDEDSAQPPLVTDILRDGRVLKVVASNGQSVGPEPEWGDEVVVSYRLTEHPDGGRDSSSRIFRLRHRWQYVIGDDDTSFLPRHVAEAVLTSMAVGERCKISVDARCFLDLDTEGENFPWLHAGTDGYERVDVERLQYDLEVVSLRKGESASALVASLKRCGMGSEPAITWRRPLRESTEQVQTWPEEDGPGSSLECERASSGLNRSPKISQTVARKERSMAESCGAADVSKVELHVDEGEGWRGSPEQEVGREQLVEQAARAAQRRARLAASSAAGRDWDPWGQDDDQQLHASRVEGEERCGSARPGALDDRAVEGNNSQERQEAQDEAEDQRLLQRVLERDFAKVRLRIEAYDARGDVVLKRRSMTYVHGVGKQADCVEAAVARMDEGSAHEVKCYSRLGLAGGPRVLRDPWLPVSFRLKLEKVVLESGPMPSKVCYFDRLKYVATSLQQHGRHFLAREKYRAILAATPADSCRQQLSQELQCDVLSRLATCEIKLRMADAHTTADILVQAEGGSARALTLRAQANLPDRPSAALADLRAALRVDPRHPQAKQLMERAKHELKRRRQAEEWFDGQGADARSREANSELTCVKCNRVRPGGRFAEKSSKFKGEYFCSECWECWVKVRRSQQRELERRVDQAIHSDYSTHTDELPSLEDTPKDWDGHHPMWHRTRRDKPDWQLANLSAEQRSKVLSWTACE